MICRKNKSTTRKVCNIMLAAAVGVGMLSACGKENEGLPDQQMETQVTATELEPQSEMANSKDTENGELTEMTETQATANKDPEPSYPEITSEDKVEDYGSVVLVGDAAYELYTYVEDTADNYARTINAVADELDGVSKVYDVVVPLGSGIVFPDNLKDQIKSSDQKEAVEEILGKMNDKVQTVNIYDALMSHRNEYIYFRTDHHWTALGAYYAYAQLCDIMGAEPEALEAYQTKEFDGFIGSFYKDADEAPILKDHPDTITAYEPTKHAVCHIEDSKGVKYDSGVIYDESKAAASLKYSTFIAGDNPYTEIVNSEVTDGSACVVVKESFGNAFVPFLVDHYQYIYVVDYRYYTGSVSKLAKEKNASDVIFVNNLSMIRNKSLVGKLYSVK